MYMATLKDLVAARRRALKLTQRMVAGSAGISAGYLGMIESGKVGIPSPGVMAALAKALRLPEEELLQSVGYLESMAVDADDPQSLELMVVEDVLERIIAMPTEADQLAAFQELPLRVRQQIRALGALVLRGDTEG